IAFSEQARVVHHDVDTAILLKCRMTEILDVCADGEVALYDGDIDAKYANFSGGPGKGTPQVAVGLIQRAPRNHRVGAVTGQAQRHGLPHSTACAGYDRDLTPYIHAFLRRNG